MTLHTPQWMQPQSPDADITYSGLELRNYNDSVIRRGNGFGGERGVLVSSAFNRGFNVAQRGSGANFSVDVASGRAIINDADATNGGVALVWSDATFNLVTPSPPTSGTNLHRVVLQLRNKLENGSYSTYDFTPVLVADTSTGGAGTFPAEPASAITLAQVSIASGQSSVTNANITDYREVAGPVSAYKASGTGRTTSSMSADPDLQLPNLASNAIYEINASIFYNGPDTTGGTTNGDIQVGWLATSATVTWGSQRQGAGGGGADVGFGYATTDTPTGQTQGTGQTMHARISGTIDTGNAPAQVLFRWGQNTTNGSTATTVMAGSYLRATRLS